MSTDPTQSAIVLDDTGLRFRIPAYEGPLDLLLDLIRKHELDIFDIPISRITEEFLGYIDTMELLDLNLGGEWVEMASMLVFIKSKMLLPRPEPDEEDGPDPREDLVRRLLEYQKYRAAADALDERDQLARDVFTHPLRASEYVGQLGPAPLKEASVTDLVLALQRIVQKSKADGTWVYEVNSQKLTLRSVMSDLAQLLATRERVEFGDLFEGSEMSRHRIITTFLALLEMTRLRMVRLIQSEGEGELLQVERAVSDIVGSTAALEIESDQA